MEKHIFCVLQYLLSVSANLINVTVGETRFSDWTILQFNKIKLQERRTTIARDFALFK
jgi:hypothetical protein